MKSKTVEEIAYSIQNEHCTHSFTFFCADCAVELITAYGDQRVREYKSAELYAHETRDW